MGIIKRIRSIIFKIKDYDRLKSNYCQVLDYASGGRLDCTNLELPIIQAAIDDHQKALEKKSKKPVQRVQKILNAMGEDSTWVVLSIYPNGRDMHFFRGGDIIKEKDLTDHERDMFITWTHAVQNSFYNR